MIDESIYARFLFECINMDENVGAHECYEGSDAVDHGNKGSIQITIKVLE